MVATATGLRRPPLTRPITDGSVENTSCTWVALGPAGEVGNRGTGAFVGHVREVDFGEVAKWFRRHVRTAAGAGRAMVESAGLGVGEAISSRAVATGTEGCATRIIGVEASGASAFKNGFTV